MNILVGWFLNSVDITSINLMSITDLSLPKLMSGIITNCIAVCISDRYKNTNIHERE